MRFRTPVLLVFCTGLAFLWVLLGCPQQKWTHLYIMNLSVHSKFTGPMQCRFQVVWKPSDWTISSDVRLRWRGLKSDVRLRWMKRLRTLIAWSCSRCYFFHERKSPWKYFLEKNQLCFWDFERQFWRKCNWALATFELVAFNTTQCGSYVLMQAKLWTTPVRKTRTRSLLVQASHALSENVFLEFKITSQFLLCCSACLIRSSLNSNFFHLVLVFLLRIKLDQPVSWDFLPAAFD